MRIPRFYLPPSLSAGEMFPVREERARYLRTVLRLRAGARLIVFDGRGGEYDAEVVTASRREMIVKTGQWHDRETESPLRIQLGLGIAKGERMDWAVQKAVELGVDAIFPLETDYCNIHLKGERREHKLQHWIRIAIAACEQCGRNRIPEIFRPQILNDWLQSRAGGVLLSPQGTPFPSLTKPESEMSLLIGPEGGLSADENRQAQQRGFIACHLGPRILRVETAVVVALSVAQAQWGDGQDVSCD